MKIIQGLKGFKELSLRVDPWRLYKAELSPSWNGTYCDTGFYSAQTTYLSMKVLTFAKNEIIWFFLNHYKPELRSKMLILQWPHQTLPWLAALETCIKTIKVGTLLTCRQGLLATTVAWPSSVQQVGCLCIVLPLHDFNYYLLVPLFNKAWYVNFTLTMSLVLTDRLNSTV